jgi:hypothetical protein
MRRWYLLSFVLLHPAIGWFVFGKLLMGRRWRFGCGVWILRWARIRPIYMRRSRLNCGSLLSPTPTGTLLPITPFPSAGLTGKGDHRLGRAEGLNTYHQSMRMLV